MKSLFMIFVFLSFSQISAGAGFGGGGSAGGPGGSGGSSGEGGDNTDECYYICGRGASGGGGGIGGGGSTGQCVSRTKVCPDAEGDINVCTKGTCGEDLLAFDGEGNLSYIDIHCADGCGTCSSTTPGVAGVCRFTK